ncbi:MAG TPA: phosphatidylinositol-specific phospholipase C/glycerophosphodiester phosphodiesterase family protein [Pirellulales bacterium]|nr:phosphatidylinositol-specific phospholipase C/glycerophosphodiester phosphodiesterase family protein [Pirellulales bacterium]
MGISALTLRAAAAAAQQRQPALVEPLHRAHAHNDYLHRRPLLDALDRGFTSVEADVFLVDGRLLVAHTIAELDPERTLEKLYLDPLRQRVEAGGGKLFADGSSLTLLVDLKRDGEATYRALAKILAQYDDIVSVVRDGRLQTKAVTVIVSGDRPRQAVEADEVRYVGIDGRLGDLDSKLPSHLLPLISDNWSSHFKWRGEGEMPQAEQDKLAAIVEKAHAAGRRVRFWAAPDRPSAWRELHAAGVDLINTDDLDGLAKFLSTADQ